jgi:hypothetical protein
MTPHFRLSPFASSDALQMITMVLISRLRLVCRSIPWIDTFSPGLTRSALSRGASGRLRRYRNVTIHDSRFVLFKRWSNKAGWRRKNALQLVHRSLSLIAACTPSLSAIDTLPDDRGLDKAAKDCNCCHYQHALLGPQTHQHKVNGDATHYLDVVIGHALGVSCTEKAHRLMCYAWHGAPSSPALVVRHLCNNIGGTCLNPYHLQWDTVGANNADVHALKQERARSQAQELAVRILLRGSQHSSEMITLS